MTVTAPTTTDTHKQTNKRCKSRQCKHLEKHPNQSPIKENRLINSLKFNQCSSWIFFIFFVWNSMNSAWTLRTHYSFPVCVCLWFHVLTSGQTTSKERNMAALKTQTECQEVSQMVVAGEVDDSGRYRHNTTNTPTTKQAFNIQW